MNKWEKQKLILKKSNGRISIWKWLIIYIFKTIWTYYMVVYVHFKYKNYDWSNDNLKIKLKK